MTGVPDGFRDMVPPTPERAWPLLSFTELDDFPLGDFEAAQNGDRDAFERLPDQLQRMVAGSNGASEPNGVEKSQPPGRVVGLVPASKISPERAQWIDDGRIPLGALSLVAGEPGLGKSIYACAELAARVSRGQAGGDLRGPAGVVVASAEDSPAYTLVPRLIAAGADLSRVHIVRVTDDGAPGTLSLPSDIDELWAMAAKVGAKLAVVDPVAAHLDGGVDSHRDASTRKALAPLAVMADEISCAVLGVVHVNKSEARSLFLRVGGSLAFFAAARSVLLVARDPEDQDDNGPHRVLVHGKCNVGPPAVTRRFAIESKEITADGDTFDTAGIAWGSDAPDVTSSTALAGAGDDDQRTERTEAEEWLRELLDEQGEVEAADAKKAGRRAGIAERTLDRARRKLGAKTQRRGFGKGAVYVWTMPAGDHPESPMAATDVHGRHENQTPETGFHGAHDGEHGRRTTHSDIAAAGDLVPCEHCGVPTAALTSGRRLHPGCEQRETP